MLTVSAASRLGLVMLDACRNNPFAARMQRSARTRAVERGFARVEPVGSVLVAFAARDGTTAADGEGRNSPFTTALLRHLETPGLEINFRNDPSILDGRFANNGWLQELPKPITRLTWDNAVIASPFRSVRLAVRSLGAR